MSGWRHLNPVRIWANVTLYFRLALLPMVHKIVIASLFGLLALALGLVLVFASVGAAFSDSTSDGAGQVVIGAGLGIALAWVGDRLLRTANADAESDVGDDSGLV